MVLMLELYTTIRTPLYGNRVQFQRTACTITINQFSGGIHVSHQRRQRFGLHRHHAAQLRAGRLTRPRRIDAARLPASEGTSESADARYLRHPLLAFRWPWTHGDVG